MCSWAQTHAPHNAQTQRKHSQVATKCLSFIIFGRFILLIPYQIGSFQDRNLVCPSGMLLYSTNYKQELSEHSYEIVGLKVKLLSPDMPKENGRRILWEHRSDSERQSHLLRTEHSSHHLGHRFGFLADATGTALNTAHF